MNWSCFGSAAPPFGANPRLSQQPLNLGARGETALAALLDLMPRYSADRRYI